MFVRAIRESFVQVLAGGLLMVSTAMCPRFSSWIRSLMGISLLNRFGHAVIKQTTGNNQAHDFVGAFQNLVHPQVAQVALKRVFANVAITAVKLQGLVDHLKTGIGGE